MEAAKLTNRQAMLLGLIVQEHVRAATPIASRALVEHYHLDVSSATVRNEMAHLEELGYLLQPHTSAGRVPTEQGFRYFVERLMEEQTLPLAERRKIAHQFHQTQEHVEQWMPLAASVLARATHGAGIITAPRAVWATYKHLELIGTHGRAVLLILVLEGGAVEQQMLSLPQIIPQNALSEVANRLNQICSGLTAEQIRPQLQLLTSPDADIAQLVLSLMEATEDALADSVYQYGLSRLLREPEFADGDTESAGLIRVLEEQSLLQAVIADGLGPSVGVGNVRVLIGGEGRWDALSACSVVLTRYGVANYATGALGVLGPMRMAYGRTISALRFVSDVLSEMVYEMYQSDLEEMTEEMANGE